MPRNALTVSGESVQETLTLAAEWQDLESRSQPTVFLSWQWIGEWLAVYQPNAMLIRVKDDDRIVGLGIVVATTERRHGVLHSRCLRLHQTGDRFLDQIWIEYNGFLAEYGYETAVSEACLSYICEEWEGWDEFIVGAIEREEADHYAAVTRLHPHIRWEAPCYGVDLNALRRTGSRYLDQLSRNTRYQIRRATRLYEERGEVRLVRPDSVDQALAMFDEIGPWHLRRWGSGPDESGFANPDFVRFHRTLIRNQWANGGVDVIAVKAGDQVIASFYNLLHQKTVYFYLGGMHVEKDNRLKPGLVGHALCIEDYRHHGFQYYDFMGGEERYKSNLGQLHCKLVQVALQRDRFKLRLEEAARRARHRLRHEFGAGQQP